MKNFRTIARVLYILMMVFAVLAAANFLYGVLFVNSSSQVSVFRAIDMMISIVDWAEAATDLAVYNILAGMIIGVLYTIFLIRIIKKSFEMFSYCRDMFDKKRDAEGVSRVFTDAMHTHIGIHFSTFLFWWISSLFTECTLHLFAVILLASSALLLLVAVFFNSSLQVSPLRGGRSYPIFNLLRMALMGACALFAVIVLLGPMTRTIVFDLEALAYLEGNGNGRYFLYFIYTCLEPTVLFGVAIAGVCALSRVVKNLDNNFDAYRSISGIFKRNLITIIVITVCRLIFTVYCGYEDVELAWTADFLKMLYGLIKQDLLPFILLYSGAMLVNYGMPAIEYSEQNKKVKILH